MALKCNSFSEKYKVTELIIRTSKRSNNVVGKCFLKLSNRMHKSSKSCAIY